MSDVADKLGGVLSSSTASSAGTPLVSPSTATTEAMEFVAVFERDYGGGAFKPNFVNFVSEGFMDALQPSRNSFTCILLIILTRWNFVEDALFGCFCGVICGG
jgi:hypothetical protein